MSKAKVTIAEVAKAAGVSTATVSRALNQPDTVSDNTSKKVRIAVDALGFRFNAAARALRNQETRRILVILPHSSSLVLAEIIKGINSVLNRHAYATLVMDTSGGAEAAEVLRLVQNQEVDGIISMDANLHDRLASIVDDAPLIYVSEWPDAPDFAFVKSDNFAGGQMAAAHLLGLGHRYLGQLSGAKRTPMARARRQGFIEKIQDVGLTIDLDWHVYSNWQMNDGLALAQRVVLTLSRGEPVPTGWFFASDEMALAFMGELLRSNISVPDKISIVGFDDIPQARYLHPSLTTVRQDPITLGTSAAHALLAMIKEEASGEPFQAVVPLELVVRKSTKTYSMKLG